MPEERSKWDGAWHPMCYTKNFFLMFRFFVSNLWKFTSFQCQFITTALIVFLNYLEEASVLPCIEDRWWSMVRDWKGCVSSGWNKLQYMDDSIKVIWLSEKLMQFEGKENYQIAQWEFTLTIVNKELISGYQYDHAKCVFTMKLNIPFCVCNPWKSHLNPWGWNRMKEKHEMGFITFNYLRQNELMK